MDTLQTLTSEQWTWIGYSIILCIVSFIIGCYMGYTECKRTMETFIQEWLPNHWKDQQ